MEQPKEHDVASSEAERLLVEKLHAEATIRLARVDADPENTISLREIIGEEGYRDFLALDADEIPDEELFS